MKQFTFFMALVLVSILGQAQSKTLQNITKFKIRNSGAIIDKNNDIDGYFFFYEVDKLKKGQREFAVQILDKNLNDVATKSYIDNKKTYLNDSGFNNDELFFVMTNLKEKVHKIIRFDKSGNITDEIPLPITKDEARYMKAGYAPKLLTPVDGKGFLINRLVKNKKLGYTFKYIPTNDSSEAWQYFSPIDSKKILSAIPIAVNEKFVVLMESSKPSLTSKKLNFKAIVLDVNTGKVLFEKAYDESNPRLITNSFVARDGNIALLGQYFEPGAKVMKAESLGLFTEVYNSQGELVFENKISWAEDIHKKIEVAKGSKLKKIGYIYFHDIIRTKAGDIYAIGEQYKKTASAVGIATGVLSALGGGIQTAGYTQLTITDAIVFKFNKDFELVDIEVFEKGKSRLQNLYDFGSPQLNSHIIKAIGGFDYQFSQIDEDNDRFYANFIDYERIKGEKNKLAFKTIIYDEGELSEDKIYLKKGNVDFRVLPGKLGHVVLFEYNKKEKEIRIHIEKLNIE